MKKNYKILIRLLGVAGIILLLISTGVHAQPEKSILLTMGYVFCVSGFIQMVLFAIKPGLFKDKPTPRD